MEKQGKNSKTNFGQKLKYLRASKNVTQEKIADYLGISRPLITQYETGKPMPLETIERICNYFGITPQEFNVIDSEDIKLDMNISFRSLPNSEKDLLHIIDFKKFVKDFVKVKGLYDEYKEKDN